ncbi:MAG: SMP-30/gluconolactonase/LRE family protein [Pseudomonadales bacterium]
METLTGGYGLVEGPVWLPGRGLAFSDVLAGGVFLLDGAGRVETLFKHRRGIGGLAFHEAGGLVVSGRNVSFKPFDGTATVLLLDRDPDAGNVGYNDLTTDAAGRIYVGSLGSSPVFADDREPAAGDLWVIDLDGSARIVGREVWLTNGLGFSPDGRELYHSDSSVRTVWRYPVAEDGDLGPREVFARTERGVPDGLAVARDGTVWVALAAGGHGVAVFDVAGNQIDFLKIPEPMCTSLCFGGDGLEDLYVVSGSEGSGSDAGGAVHRFAAVTAGCEMAPARVPIPR